MVGSGILLAAVFLSPKVLETFQTAESARAEMCDNQFDQPNANPHDVAVQCGVDEVTAAYNEGVTKGSPNVLDTMHEVADKHKQEVDRANLPRDIGIVAVPSLAAGAGYVWFSSPRRRQRA